MFVDAVRSFSNTTPDVLEIDRISHLWFLAHSDSIADVPDQLRQIQVWAAEIRKNDVHAVPGVKPHLCERNLTFLSGINSIGCGVVILPYQIPAELMAPSLNQECVIRSSLSTFIVTSRLLLPGRKIELESDPSPAVFEKLSAWDSGISK